MLNGKVTWQASDSSLSKELHGWTIIDNLNQWNWRLSFKWKLKGLLLLASASKFWRKSEEWFSGNKVLFVFAPGLDLVTNARGKLIIDTIVKIISTEWNVSAAHSTKIEYTIFKLGFQLNETKHLFHVRQVEQNHQKFWGHRSNVSKMWTLTWKTRWNGLIVKMTFQHSAFSSN